MGVDGSSLGARLLIVPIILICLKIIPCFAIAPQMLVSPSSILVPVNTVANFECIAYCTKTCDGTWYIRGTPTATSHEKAPFIHEGFIFPHTSPTNGTYRTTISVNASTTSNNTRLWCRVDNDGAARELARSAIAVLYILSEPMVVPNPLIILQATSVLLKWCPPYLWAGHRIKYYTILTTNMTDGSVTSDIINATFSDDVVTLNKSRQDEDCAEFRFTLSAVNTENENLKVYEVTKGYEQAPEGFNSEAISTTVLFFANTTPIIRINAQLPPMICDHQDVNYTIIIDSMNESSIIELGPFHQQGPGTVNHEIVSNRIIKDEEYSVKVILFTSLHTVVSKNYSLDTTFLPGAPSTSEICIDGIHSDHNHAVKNYRLVLGICISVTFIVLSLVTLVIPIWVYRHWNLHKNKEGNNTSAERICNAMVPNPIYSGPLYESVQPHFDALTSITASTCEGQQSNSQASTPSSSEKSVRYVDPPSHSPKKRSKSFVSSGPSHSSMPTSDASNIARSTSVSIPAVKKSEKQRNRNKLNLTLALTGMGSTGTTGVQNAQSSTTEPISVVNPVVLMNVDDNYTVMSPVAGRSVLAGVAEWSELSPEDTDKYKE